MIGKLIEFKKLNIGANVELSAVKAEISTHVDLLSGIGIDADVVNEIDRHIKDVERQLNERLVLVSATFIAENFLPKDNKGRSVTRVDNEVWDSLFFGKNWFNQVSHHEELSFRKCTKGYAFYYTSGEVEWDLGIVECDGVDWYARIIEDRRESFKVTGAPVEIKLRAFQHLSGLLTEIADQAGNMNLETSRR